jgi:alpha-amylase
MIGFRKQVIAQDSKYVTTVSNILYSDFETIVLQKNSVITVLTNTGSRGSQYSITIPMKSTSFTSGTEFTDIISCNTLKVASTGDFVPTIQGGTPQVPPPEPPQPHFNYVNLSV